MFQYLLSFLTLYKYWAVFLFAFLSSVALPIPASFALAAAGGFASQGYLNIYAVLFITTLGSVLGDLLDYFLAFRYGEKFLNKIIFFRHLLRSSTMHKVEEYIVDFAPSLIFSSRFLTELSPATNLMAGLFKVSFKTFFIFVLLGEVVYTMLYGMAGFLLGSQWQNNISFITKAGLIMLSIGIVINLTQVLLYKRRKKDKLKK